MADPSLPKRRGRKAAPNVFATPAATPPLAKPVFEPAPLIAAADLAAPVPASVATVSEPVADAVETQAETSAATIEAVPAAVAETIETMTETADDTLQQDSAVAEPTWKDEIPMATTFDAAPATEKAKAVFGDINERAKTAMEKSVKIGEEVTEFTKGNVEALVASGRVAAKGAETIAQDVAETVKKHFETTTATMKSFASVKSPTELFQLQSDYAKTYFDGAVADASKFSESLMKLFGDIAQPLSSRYALAAEKIKATAL